MSATIMAGALAGKMPSDRVTIKNAVKDSKAILKEIGIEPEV